MGEIYCLLRGTSSCGRAMFGEALFQVLADSVEIVLHGFRVVGLDYFLRFGQVLLYLLKLYGGVGIEQNLAEQVVVFAHKSVCYGLVALERGARSRLVLHTTCKHEG